MKTTTRLLDIVRFAAAGGIVASALTNITFNVSDATNMVVAGIGAILTVLLVKAKHIA